MYRILYVGQDLLLKENATYMTSELAKDFTIHAHADFSSDVVHMIQSMEVALVLLNIKNAHTLGLGLCKTIREVSSVPIILLGGSHNFDLARKALALNVSDYLADPVDWSELSKSMKAVKQRLDALPSSNSRSVTVSQLSLEAAKSSCNIIKAIKKFVQEQMHENITLKKISDSLSFNCAYLGQKFKQHEHMTFNEYLLKQRMEKAKTLLETTDMKIYEISSAVGYTDIDWFYKKFKEHTGASANEYRKQGIISA